MAEILQCRKTKNSEMIDHLTELRTFNLRKANPKANPIKKMDIVDEVLEKGFAHKSLKKEIALILNSEPS